MENFSHTYTADLVVFSEVQDLPPSLRIFVEIKGNKEKMELRDDTKVIILKIRETTDCYSALLLHSKEPTVWAIEREIRKDLMGLPVRLSWYSREKTRKLLEELKQNNFVCYIDNQMLNTTNMSNSQKQVSQPLSMRGDTALGHGG